VTLTIVKTIVITVGTVPVPGIKDKTMILLAQYGTLLAAGILLIAQTAVLSSGLFFIAIPIY